MTICNAADSSTNSHALARIRRTIQNNKHLPYSPE
jgi:hypothetical protein